MSLLRCEILPRVVSLHSCKIWRQLRKFLVKLKSPKVKTFVNYLTVCHNNYDDVISIKTTKTCCICQFFLDKFV